MILNYKLLPNAKTPTKKNKSDIGWDLYAYSMRVEGEEIRPGLFRRIQYLEYNLGICIQPQEEMVWFSTSGGALSEVRKYFTYLAPRSSVSDYNLQLCPGFGTIDAGYNQPVLARFRYIYQPEDVVFLDPEKHPSFGIQINEDRIYKIGEKCAQLIVTNQPFVTLNQVEELLQTDRNGGHGSTGKR